MLCPVRLEAGERVSGALWRSWGPASARPRRRRLGRVALVGARHLSFSPLGVGAAGEVAEGLTRGAAACSWERARDSAAGFHGLASRSGSNRVRPTKTSPHASASVRASRRHLACKPSGIRRLSGLGLPQRKRHRQLPRVHWHRSSVDCHRQRRRRSKRHANLRSALGRSRSRSLHDQGRPGAARP